MEPFIPVLTAILGVVGTLLTSRWTNNTTLTKTNIENAMKFYKKYEDLNKQLKEKVDSQEDKISQMEDKMDQMERKMELMEREFEKERAYYEQQIEDRDEIIEEKEVIIERLNEQLIEKDKTIKKLRGESLNGVNE